MTRRLVVSRRAENEIAKHDRWWRQNRDNVNAFSEDIANALELLRRSPEVGTRTMGMKRRDVFRHTIGRIRYYMYYTYSPDDVRILAIWHTSRERSPRL
jgi:plasmid stabilization system protein ParE